MVEAFWAQPPQGNYKQVITALLDTLGPPPKTAANQGRSTRMVLDRMGLEGGTDAGLQDIPGNHNDPDESQAEATEGLQAAEDLQDQMGEPNNAQANGLPQTTAASH